MKVLITAPSLDENVNVSGISTIVRQIIEYGNDEYSHFVAGREDGESTGPRWAAKQAALPLRFFARIVTFRPDVVHVNTALTNRSILRDAALVAAAKFTGTPVIVAIHGGKYLVDNFANKKLKRFTGNTLRKAQAVVVYSDYERALVTKKWDGLNIQTLPNAIPREFIGSTARNNDVPVFVYFGRMHESKGLDELMDACRSLKDNGFKFQLNAFGEGPIRDRFINGMRDALGEYFTYGGVIGGNAKWQILRDSDIFLLPSRYGEGLPMAMLEAMATGCIVVAADVASVSSVVHNGTNGYLIKPYDAEGLASKLKVILSDKLEWETIRENAVNTVLDKFEIKDYLERLGQIYSSTIRD